MSSAPISRSVVSLAAGLVLGAASWAIVPLVSDVFEPFDSSLAFYLGQFILVLAAFLVGLFWGGPSLCAFLVALYISNNAYPYFFGSSDAKGYVLIAMVTTIMLCIYPLLAGMIGVLVKGICLSIRLTRRSKATK